MSEEKATGTQLSEEELQDLVASTDTGGRNPVGSAGKVILGAALLWSLFQVWIASPLPFIVGVGVFNDTEARSIHLAFSVFLAFLAFPALKRSPRDHIPVQDWVLAVVAALAAAYNFILYTELSARPNNPNMTDIVVFCVGIVLLLEATRRALGPPLMIVAMVFLLYTFGGPHMPGILAWKGASFGAVAYHQWLSSEGVFGIALGVSTSFVFLFVLFGALLDKAGAGNYFIKVAFSLLGHYRGGPAKAAVVASAMTGLISGSSIANVVTTGTFTIPMMKRVGFSPEKAGAVEVASSVNGQIMPPVMGAAAFLMVEYVGISYFEVVTNAFVPALISYIALVYIVHLEAMKADMLGLPRASAPKPWMVAIMGFLIGFIGIAVLAVAVYYGIGWIKLFAGDSSGWVIAAALTVVYIGLVKFCAGYPELELDDPNSPVVSLPLVGPTVKSGLQFILPVVVLVWCLMVERLSPGLSAFWATAFMLFILITQRPLFAFFRGAGDLAAETRRGWNEMIDGLITGARNMIGIGIATATAGIIVGAVSQTGVGLVLAELVEVLSFGNIMLILIWTAVLSLILGMGLPTTANYIVVSSLLAPVIVQLGQDAGLIVPLIAVHLFVFYFGIMADVTPPVGLASFAAAAVSGGDPIKTGFVAFFYSLRTAALPFLFIFNTDLLLIDVGWIGGIAVFIVATVAMLIFAAATQGFFLARNRVYETVALLLIAFTLFRPGFWMDMISPPTRDVAPAQIVEIADRLQAGDELRLRVDGQDAVGNPRSFVAILPLGEGETGEDRLVAAGLELYIDGDVVEVDNAIYDSDAKAAGLDFGQKIVVVKEPIDQLPKELMYIPALLVLGLIVFMQRGRRARQLAGATA
ncbi:TRAP transporter permease [Pelagibius marinus]|uniref:TRAP transporter permease n=1 Tax=Pelagibius marinus TaxID=2762760 RepID=UPI00187323A7|nr:TRAP transporter permease [Pelagibius marinus]